MADYLTPEWLARLTGAADPAVRAQATQISLYDEIGMYGVTAADFAEQLAEAGTGDVQVNLNSCGGDVFDGIAIYNQLRGHKGQVTIVVDGLAASIASVIAMAASPGQLSVASGAMMMIHDALALTIGNAADHREMADVLDKASDNLASIYARRSGRTTARHRTAMRAETWYTADEAVDAGLADRVAGAVSPAARYARGSGMAASSAPRWDSSAFERALAGSARPRGVDASGRPLQAGRKRQFLAMYEQLRDRRYGSPHPAERIAASAGLESHSPVARRIFGP